MKVFVSGTGTGVGKTWFATALTAELVRRGRSVGALKPVETGCEPDPLDALLLAKTSGHPELAHAAGLHRALRPLAPWAATLAGDVPTPAIAMLVDAVNAALAPFADRIVEGAGGLLVPYDAEHDLADLALALELPVVLVAADVLGTLSHTRTAFEAARSRGLTVAAVVLTRPEPPTTPEFPTESAASNAAILRARLGGVPVIELPHLAPREVGDADVTPSALAAPLDTLIAILDAAHARPRATAR